MKVIREYFFKIFKKAQNYGVNIGKNVYICGVKVNSNDSAKEFYKLNLHLQIQ